MFFTLIDNYKCSFIRKCKCYSYGKTTINKNIVFFLNYANIFDLQTKKTDGLENINKYCVYLLLYGLFRGVARNYLNVRTKCFYWYILIMLMSI